jgi:hypothetical protein
LKIIITASKVIELEVPKNIKGVKIRDFIIHKVREDYLDSDDWMFDNWEEIKPEKSIT